MRRKVWDTRFAVPETDRYDELRADGWEPIGCAANPGTQQAVLFRKKVKPDPPKRPTKVMV